MTLLEIKSELLPSLSLLTQNWYWNGSTPSVGVIIMPTTKPERFFGLKTADRMNLTSVCNIMMVQIQELLIAPLLRTQDTCTVLVNNNN